MAATGDVNLSIPEGEEQQEQGNDSPSTTSSTSDSKSPPRRSVWRKIYDVITYTPKRCRHDPEHPHGFSMPLNLLFGFAATFTGEMSNFPSLQFKVN